MKPFQVRVDCKYGAPMGRASDALDQFHGLVHLEEVPFVDGDYDEGGAYWGGPPSDPLWCAWDDDGHEFYLRAFNMAAARQQLPAWNYWVDL